MKLFFITYFLLIHFSVTAQENCDINEDIYKADSTLVVEKLQKFFSDLNSLTVKDDMLSKADEFELKLGIVQDLLQYFPLKQGTYKRLGSIYI